VPVVPVDRYLARIGYTGDRSPGVAQLAALQLAHLRAVPFENLDVYARRGVRVDLDWSLPKIVERRRGGWCFELNGAFGALLMALGYTVTRHSAQVDDGAGLGPELDHLALVVHLDGRRWLVDVGFGDSSLAPLDLDETLPQDGLVRRSRLVPCVDAPGSVELFDELPDGTFDRQYRLDPTPRELAAFAPRSELLQTEPGLTWTQRRFATRPTAAGRVWLLTDRLKHRVGDGHAATTETEVAPTDWDAALAEHLEMVEGS
jgi:N-hydroxyarylamine O-acetyltransferase